MTSSQSSFHSSLLDAISSLDPQSDVKLEDLQRSDGALGQHTYLQQFDKKILELYNKPVNKKFNKEEMKVSRQKYDHDHPSTDEIVQLILISNYLNDQEKYIDYTDRLLKIINVLNPENILSTLPIQIKDDILLRNNDLAFALRYGASPSTLEKIDRDCITVYCGRDQLNCIKYCLEQGDVVDGYDLSVAAANGNLEVVEFLLDTPVKFKDERGQIYFNYKMDNKRIEQAIEWAEDNDRDDMVKYLKIKRILTMIIQPILHY